MSERMKALPIVVYELFIKNSKKCSLKALPISVPSFQFLAQGEEEFLSRDGWARNTERSLKLFGNLWGNTYTKFTIHISSFVLLVVNWTCFKT